jgi:hypothetical protein
VETHEWCLRVESRRHVTGTRWLRRQQLASTWKKNWRDEMKNERDATWRRCAPPWRRYAT